MSDNCAIDSQNAIACKIRKDVLRILFQAGASHLGSNMSMIEILVSIFSAVDTNKLANQTMDRPRIFVSKGHAAASVYATLCHFGILSIEELETYHQDSSFLTGHVNHNVIGIEHSTGALGHGMNVATGCALGLQSKGMKDTPVFAILGDGELQEGSIWEALMFCAHHRLTNLITFIDYNKISSITQTNDVVNLEPLRNKFESFGFVVHNIDGHDITSLSQAITNSKKQEKPSVVICNTIKGKGVSFAENQPIWHYRPLSKELYEKAISELEAFDL